MMELDLMDAENQEIREVLKKCITRINSISKLHDKISWSNETGTVHLSDTIHELSDYIDEAFSNNKHISTVLETDDVFVNIKDASSYTLLLNELLTNAYKHAFTDQQKGTIWIKLEQKTIFSICK